MSRKKKTQNTEVKTPPVIRSHLHAVLAGRKSGKHRPDREKRVGQKLRRELEES